LIVSKQELAEKMSGVLQQTAEKKFISLLEVRVADGSSVAPARDPRTYWAFAVLLREMARHSLRSG